MSLRQSLLIVFLAGLVVGCAQRINTISTRQPGLFDKENSQRMIRSRKIGDEQRNPPELFVRKKKVQIVPMKPKSQDGSLYNPNDERNFLFSTGAPLDVGRYVTINITSNRVIVDSNVDKPTKKAKDGEENAEKDAEEDLLKILPDLAPARPGQIPTLKKFKLKIAHHFDNGDVLAIARRRSLSEKNANEIFIQARIPYERLIAGDALSTDDLYDVNWRESRDGELMERQSPGWEDEFTIRMSGFSEARSKVAQELEDNRRRLREVRDKLRDRINAFGRERQQLAKQREDLLTKQSDDEKSMAELNEKIKRQEETIEAQKEEISALKPEEKPGDEKDGGDGD